MAQGENGTPIKRRFWLITSPRTASNMLVKILNLDEQGVRPGPMAGGYFFLPAAVERLTRLQTPMSAWTEEDHEVLNKAQQDAFNALQDYLAAAEQEGQRIFVKEHAFTMTNAFFEHKYTYGDDAVSGEPKTLVARGVDNPTRSPLNLTVLPDEFLKTWHPTFLIRHPALMVPSLFRTAMADMGEHNIETRRENGPFKAETTMKWIRTLYEFYVAQFPEGSQWPIILDADDIMKTPEIVAKYAPMVGLDPAKLRFSWEKVPEEKMKAMPKTMQVMLSHISATSQIDHSKMAGNIDIDAEAAKWRADFGEEMGRKIEKCVRDMMPDYLAMHAKRLRLD